MDLNQFFENHKIEAKKADAVESAAAEPHCLITGAIRGHTKDTLLIEHCGTIYEIQKRDVIDIAESRSPVVTDSGKGLPVDIQVKPEAELTMRRKILASEFDRERPFSLQQPSQAGDYVFETPFTPREEIWFRERDIVLPDISSARPPTMSSSSCTAWTSTQSPSTYHPKLDNWRDDESRNDGNRPDESRVDD